MLRKFSVFRNLVLRSRIPACGTYSSVFNTYESKFANFSRLCLPAFTTSRGTMTESFSIIKEKMLQMSAEERRPHYICGKNYVTLDHIPVINKYLASKQLDSGEEEPKYSPNPVLNEKVSIFTGDITTLEIDAIVNAANKSLQGGGGVDGAIHRAAGKNLLFECRMIGGCPTGGAVVTGGYGLPARYVIHTVGPVGENPELLRSCYDKSLSLVKENEIKSLAFPCISTGIYGYPNENAAHIALAAVREWLEKNHESVTRIIFCLFLEVDIKIYERLIPQYFPL